MVVLSGEPHVAQHVVQADQHDVDALDRDDLVGLRAQSADSNCTITMVASLIALAVSSAGNERYCRCGNIPVFERSPSGGSLAALHHRARLGGRAHMRRDHAERAGVQDARDIVGRVRRNPHRRHDADVEAGHADLPGGVHRQRRMLQVDVEHVEARRLGDAGDLDGAAEPHRHRGHDLAAGELFLDVVAQDVAGRHFKALLVCGQLGWPDLRAGGMIASG